MHLSEMGQELKFDFFQVFHFKLYFWVLNIKSVLKMCCLNVDYVNEAQKMRE